MFPIPGNNSSGGGQRVSKKVEEWTNSFLRQTHVAHKILTALCQDIDTGEDTALLEPPGITVQGALNYGGLPAPQLAQTFIEKCQQLISSLGSKIDVPVKFPVGVMLKLISRCLNIQFKDVVSLPSLKELASIIPSIQQTALELLLCLIWCCRSSLLPQSRMIVDLLQQVLRSTEVMEDQPRSILRSCVHHTLCQWVQMAGMGRQAQWGQLVKEIVTDLEVTQKPPQMNGSAGPLDTSSDISFSKSPGTHTKGKNKKGKKKRGDAYKELENSHSSGTLGDQGCQPHVAQLTTSALQLSSAILERGQFLQLQKLSSCVTDMAASLQRCPAAQTSPYSLPDCRLTLYRAVWRTSQVSLDIGVGTAETVAHFQLTNKALSLISHAAHKDSSVDVQNFCQEKICFMLSYKNLQRPIVRKALPDEQEDAANLSEASKEVEKLNEENERLRKRLLEVELELQRKSVTEKVIVREKEGSTTEKVYGDFSHKHDTIDTLSVHSDASEDENECNFVNSDEDTKPEEDDKEAMSPQKRKKDTEYETKRNNKKQKVEKDIKTGKFVEEKILLSTNKKEESSDVNIKSKNESQVKSVKQDISTSVKTVSEKDDENPDSIVQEMLMDFVDADPDK